MPSRIDVPASEAGPDSGNETPSFSCSANAADIATDEIITESPAAAAALTQIAMVTSLSWLPQFFIL
jgi:hypothetical protein